MNQFSVIEYSSFFAVRNNETGEEQPMSDGVDVLFDGESAIKPGTKGFCELWEELLNKNPEETIEAYFS